MTTAAASTGPRLANDLLNLVGLQTAAAAADHGLVRRLPPAAERDAGRQGAARLRELPPLRPEHRT